MQPLPIDPHLPALVAALREHGALVLVAEPGAGKTTRVPRALLDAGFGADGEIVVLEPRRLAARLAARRVAEELGEEPGGRVGYQVRFEERAGPATRIRFVTEGILARRLAADPGLPGIGTVILDEFHERSLHADLALALLKRLRDGARPGLRLAVMSATLDGVPLARFLGAPFLDVPGRPFDVAVEYDARPGDRPLDGRVASAVRRLLAEEPEGDVLVFLPGAAEIRRCTDALGAPDGVLVTPLHGDLSLADQERAVRRADRRKVVLATNVAETSLTIDGVRAVVDSGLHRVAGHSPWSGLPTLEVRPISRASAAQRAGRAGRTGPGRCVRLYTQHDHDHRPAHDPPEIRRADLAEPLLLLAALGVAEPGALAFLDDPPEAAVAAARALLARLGALDEGGAPTARGRAMLRIPAHPRAARLLLAAAEAGRPRAGALLAALLGERDVRREARTSFGTEVRGAASGGPSDLLDQAERLEGAERAGLTEAAFRRFELDAAAARAVIRARDQLLQAAGVRSGPDGAGDPAPLLRAVLAAFPDRVGRRRTPGASDVVFAGGGSGRLAAQSVVQTAPFLVAVEADEQAGRGRVIRLASAVEPDWMLDLFPERVRENVEAVFDPATERVVRLERLLYDGLVLDETRRTDATGPDVEAALLAAARAAGSAAFADPGELARLAARVETARAAGASIPAIDEHLLDDALARLCAGRRSFREMREAGLAGAIRETLGGAALAALERLAPERITLASGRSVRVEYESGRPPFVGSYLQDFFGQAEGPRLGGVPLVLHLWAPSRRPLQVTTDLSSFWDRHYPELRRQLMRRYPKHQWPEDPRSASPRRRS